MGNSKSKDIKEELELIECGNKTCTKTHLISAKTKLTVCGLKWKKDVWIADAIYINYGKNCKVCFKGRK